MFPIVKVQPKSNLREMIACYKYSYFGIWFNCLLDCIIRNYDNDNNDNFKISIYSKLVFCEKHHKVFPGNKWSS